MRFEPSKCPECGQRAKGTLETIPGIALLEFDEDCDADYQGETKVWWDGQQTARSDDGRVRLVCPDGHEWPASDDQTPSSPPGEDGMIEVEYFRCWGQGGDSDTWDTGYLEIPANTPDDQIQEAIEAACRRVDWADDVPVLVGLYHLPGPEELVDELEEGEDHEDPQEGPS